MAFDAELGNAFNRQITREFAAAYQYLAMGAWLDENSLPGMAHWMRLQAEEEWEHAMRFYQFVLDRNGSIVLGAIEAPTTDFAGPLDVFRAALAGEQDVTSHIHDLYALATARQDFASFPLLGWFVNEQVEEEATVSQIIDDLERSANEGHAILMLDRELGARSAQ